jgi:DNA primase
MDAVEEIKSRLSIEDVISEYVQLKRAGRNWKGLSPFTSEKTPSFTVSPEKQIWHDFSSGQGGDMFTFVQAVEGVDFKGSLDILARRAGIDLEQFQPKGSRGGPDKERLYAANELAAKFYQTQLGGSKIAIDYVFKKRQFTKETALTWRLGYAPNTGKALIDFLKKQGYNEAEIKLAGLTNRFGGDMFRERLMIPLADAQGRIVGFTARQLSEGDNGPKYLNTPGTPLYDKSRHVYGLHLAKETIRKSKFVVLAEGNLDVIMSHQAGVKQVVATAGTALTEPHLKTLGRLTGDIRLCFDADNAGMNATERAIPIASRTKVSLSIINIPSGKDPDELIKQNVALWQEIIQKPQYALDWLMERYQNVLDVTTAEGKRKYSDVLLPVVKSLADPVEQDHYLNAISDVTGTSIEALATKMRTGQDMSTTPQPRRRKIEQNVLDKSAVESIKTEDHYLALMLLHRDLRAHMGLLRADMFTRTEAGEMFAFLETHPDFGDKKQSFDEMAKLLDPTSPPEKSELLQDAPVQGGQEKRSEPYQDTVSEQRTGQHRNVASSGRKVGDSVGEQSATVQKFRNYVKMLGLEYDELYSGLEFTELQYEAARLQARLVETFVKTKKQTIGDKLQNADEAETRNLLSEAKELDALLNTVSGGN